MPAMFLDMYLSDAGRSTQLGLDTLRRQLGPGVDPCFDYQAPVEHNPPPRDTEDSKQEEEGDGMKNMDRLRLLMREFGVHSDDDFGEEDNPWLAEKDRHELMARRRRREEMRPSSAFKNRSRQDLQRLQSFQSCAPPMGTYRPRDDCLARYGKVLNPPDKVPPFARAPFGHQKKTQSRKVEEVGAELRGIHENKLAEKKNICHVDIAKQLPRGDFLKDNGIVCNETRAIDPEGALNGHLKCAKYGKSYRQPCFDFAKLSTAAPKPPESVWEPLPARAPQAPSGSGTLPFDKRPGRKDLIDTGTSTTAHLPDRSLARDCQILAKYGKVCAPVVKVPDISKYTERPPLIDPARLDWHDENDPHTHQLVLDRQLSYDAESATKLQHTRPRSASDMKLSLTRQQELRSQRQFGNDICYSLAKENENRGPTSTELQRDDMTVRPSLRPKVQTADFERMPGREATRLHCEAPARNKDMTNVAKFQRPKSAGQNQRRDTRQLARPASAPGTRRGVR